MTLTLHELWTATIKLGQTIAADEELTAPLLMTDGTEGLAHARLLLPPTVPIHAVAKLMIYQQRAEVAAICFEGWVAAVAKDDPLLVELKARRIQVRDLPPERRGDALWVFGESRLGERLNCSFRIRRPGPGQARRTFEPAPGGGAFEANPFDRLMLDHAEVAPLRAMFGVDLVPGAARQQPHRARARRDRQN